MFGITSFEFFLVAVFLLNVTPGPDTAYIVGRSVAQGRGAGIMSALGISAGLLRAYARVRVRLDRAAGGIGDGVHRHQVCRRDLSDLSRRAPDLRQAGRPSRAAKRARAERAQVAAPAVPARLLDERAESEGRTVLRVVLPAVRHRRQRHKVLAFLTLGAVFVVMSMRVEQFCRVDRGQRDAAFFRQAGGEEVAGPRRRQRIRRTGNQARHRIEMIEFSALRPYLTFSLQSGAATMRHRK